MPPPPPPPPPHPPPPPRPLLLLVAARSTGKSLAASPRRRPLPTASLPRHRHVGAFCARSSSRRKARIWASRLVLLLCFRAALSSRHLLRMVMRLLLLLLTVLLAPAPPRSAVGTKGGWRARGVGRVGGDLRLAARYLPRRWRMQWHRPAAAIPLTAAMLPPQLLVSVSVPASAGPVLPRRSQMSTTAATGAKSSSRRLQLHRSSFRAAGWPPASSC